MRGVRRAFLLSVALIAVTATATASPTPTSIRCGAVTRLEQSRHPQVGPLVLGFYTLGENTTGRARSVFDAGYPTKVLLFTVRRRALRYPMTLRGWNCADGKRLRFWYRGGPPPLRRLPAPIEELERTGDLVQTLRAHRYGEWRGYMLFTKAGKWKISVWQRSRLRGSIVVEVGG